MNLSFRYSLFQALLVYVIVPLISALALAGYLSLTAIENRVEEKMEDEVQLVARALQRPLSHALERGRTGSIRSALTSVFEINRLYAATVYDKNGRQIASAGASVLDRHRDGENKRIAAMAKEGNGQEEYGPVGGREAYSYFAPLTDSGGRINGLLQLSRKEADIKEHIADLRFQSGLILSGGALIMVLLVLFGHRRALGRHLDRLGRSMRRVEQGDRSHRGDLRGPKEITSLASAFNTMLDSMEKAHEDVERHRQEQARLESELRKAEKMAAVGRLAAGVAHELGTPLSIIDGLAQRAGRLQGLPPRVTRALQQIRDQVKRMESIVRQLLDFSRSSSSCRRDVDPASVVRQAIQNTSSLAEQKEVHLEQSGPGTGCLLHADPLRLEQMLTNLLKNAVQAAPQKQGHVRIQWECTARECVIRVQDNGPGIDPDQVSRVCDPFYTTKPVGEGTGLGLAVVHGIVEENEGVLHIDTAALGGAEFTIALPKGPAEGKGQADCP
ncbi:sensor histidine kinase [Desulfovermiculus halophilus]|uniref:sensor histidine kinase n=1 Tax=Desulfovermiculus halophilus TaxID=339722 RepID=UPI000687567D|nr:ATP-binding protein [Desulfovermiculus halophilus]